MPKQKLLHPERKPLLNPRMTKYFESRKTQPDFLLIKAYVEFAQEEVMEVLSATRSIQPQLHQLR
jgi:hypothetical protein